MSRGSRIERAAASAVAVTTVLAAAKLAVWGATGSLVVLSQALDSVIDVVVMGLVWIGVRYARRPADRTHHYGHAKAENLIAFAQTLVLGLIVLAIVVHAARQLAGAPAALSVPWYAVALLGTSMVVDAVRALALLRTARAERSDALRAGALNIASDVGTAAVAVGSLVAVRAGMEKADAIGALLVATVVAVAAVRLGARSAGILMDRAPIEPAAAIEAAASAVTGVAETRRVRVRGDGRQLFADVTVAAARTASLERAHDIAERVEAEIQKVVPRADVVVHVEPSASTSGLVERVHAAASKIADVQEVHNVSVHAFSERGRSRLHVTLHAKVPANASLEEAHRISDRVEQAVAHEVGSDARVDTHIEPLLGTAPGQDVTTDRGDVVDSFARLALDEIDVLDCHEVLVTASGPQLSVVAHVRGRGDLPLERMHDASERIEKALHAAHPEVGAVVIHFEPA